eukprot:652880-Prymnesium_polylepis.1
MKSDQMVMIMKKISVPLWLRNAFTFSRLFFFFFRTSFDANLVAAQRGGRHTTCGPREGAVADARAAARRARRAARRANDT